MILNQPGRTGSTRGVRSTPRKEEAAMSINLKIPDIRELKPRITVFGCGGAGGNAVNNMIASGLDGVDFVVANTDAQALTMSKAERIIDRKSTRLNSGHSGESRMPSSA